MRNPIKYRAISEPLERRQLLTSVPELAWSRYVGGPNIDGVHAGAVDGDGNVYMTGQIASEPAIVKMNADGTQLWSSIFEGAGNNFGLAITVDVEGNAYVAGQTSSPLPWVTYGAFQGSSEGFIVKVNSAGQHLWSSYIGGSNADQALGIALDGFGAVYVTGFTRSTGWISGGFDTTLNGSEDGFLVKLTADGGHIWSTYLCDSTRGIAIDESGQVYVTGLTYTAGWVSGGFDTSPNGDVDAFAAKLSPEGQHLWSTYIGGNTTDHGFDVALDGMNNVYVTGRTKSAGWTSGGYDTVHGTAGVDDAFVLKMTGSGAYLWSTYLGGAGSDEGKGITVDSVNDAVYVVGNGSSDWVSGGFDLTPSIGGDAFAARLNTMGDHVWSTYFGGNNYDHGNGIALDGLGNLYVVGLTSSTDLESSGDTTYNGGFYDAYIAKITDHSDITIPVFENSTFNYLSTSQQTLTVTFDENISASLAASDFVLTNLNTNATVALTLQSIAADGQSATFTFSATGNDLGDAILTDGHYRIRALAGQIEDESGNALAEDVDHFFDFKNADVANADQVVDFSDLLVVAQHYGMTSATFADGDVNYDGEVNFNDLLAVAQRYGSGIPELRIGRFIPTPIKSRSIVGDVFGSEAIMK